MNLDELRSVQSKERQKDSLQNLRPSFYQEVGEYIADLEDERDRVAEQAEDPFSEPEVGRLTDEIETAKDVVEAIYERRMGKLVKQASLAAAGMPANDDGLTAEESDLFDDLVDRISSNKSRVLDVLEGIADPVAEPAADTDSAAGPDPVSGGVTEDPESVPDHSSADGPTPDDAPPAPTEAPSSDGQPAEAEPSAADSSGVSPADVMGGDEPSVGTTDGTETGRPDDSERSSEPSDVPSDRSSDGGTAGAGDPTPPNPAAGTDRDTDPPAAEPDSGSGDGEADGATDTVDRTTVRITSDIGSILGVDDREYTLTSDDVVTLPEQNAAPLLEREAAERLE
jgi:DNA replication factor GINS